MAKLRIGIIGPGDVTERVMQGFSELKDNVESISFYDHGGSFKEQYKSHVETLFRAVPGYKVIMDVQAYPHFSTFMNQSDVIILNVGADTPLPFLNGTELVSHFADLESMLEREGHKSYREYEEKRKKKKKPISMVQADYLGDFITAYQILKEVNMMRTAGDFDQPLRMNVALPATLPIVMRYAYKMREFFDKNKEVSASSKLLIVNSNCSENNLNAILSVVPELRGSSVSLAIERKRLMTLLNTDKDIPLPSSCLIYTGVVGDHDSYPLPNFTKVSLQLLATEDQRRIDEFATWLKDNYNTLYNRMKGELRNFYIDRKGKQDLLDHAGEGVLDLLRSIFDEKMNVTSGYYTELGLDYDLPAGQGLCFVDDHTISWTEQGFRVIPQRQKLDEVTRNLFQECKRAHVKLHQRFVDNPLIPVFGFPGSAHRTPTLSSPQIVAGYNTGKRRHTEVLVPVWSTEDKKQKLIALDVSSLERRVVPFEGRTKDDKIRCVTMITLDGKDFIACGFTKDYTLIEPETFTIIKSYPLTVPLARTSVDGTVKQYRINSLVSAGKEVFLTHDLYGLVATNINTGEQKVFYSPKPNDGPVRGVKLNPQDHNLYFIVGRSIFVYSPLQEKLIGKFTSSHQDSLESIVFDNQNIYVSTKRNIKKNAYILAASIGKYKEGLERLDGDEKIKENIIFMDGFYQNLLRDGVPERIFHLLCSHGGTAAIHKINEKAKGKVASWEKVKSYHSSERGKIPGNKGGVGGLVTGVHAYVTYGNRDPSREQGIYEIDLRTFKQELLFDCQKVGEYVGPTITLLNLTR